MSLVIACAAAVSAESPTGAVYVTTLPAGAEIWIDGTYLGRAPLLVDGLTAGRHSVSITKTGWTVREVDVTIAAGAIALSSTRLATGSRAAAGAAGSVVVHGAPLGAALVLDGKAFAAPAGHGVALPPGIHHIGMVTPHGRTTRAFTVVPETTTDLVLREARPSDASAPVVAPAEDYLPTDAFTLSGPKIVVRYGGHVVIAHLGDPVARIDGANASFDAAPAVVAGKLFLPLRLLEKLTDDSSPKR